MSSSIKPILGSQLELGHPLATGLVGLWLMNEGSGNLANDLSGNGNTGTFVGTAPSWSAGKFGSAVFFPGTDEYIEVFDGRIDDSSQGTIVAWVKFDSIADDEPIFSYGGGSAGTPGGFFFRSENFGGDQYLNILQRSDGAGSFNNVRSPAGVFVADVWYQAVLVSDGTAWSFFINGISQQLSVAGGSNNGNWLGDTVVGETDLTVIGAQRFSGGFNELIDGHIDHLLLYNRALSAGEIALLYREPFIMFERDPIELWVGATSVGVAPGANPKGPLGHPLHGALAGPISF